MGLTSMARGGMQDRRMNDVVGAGYGGGRTAADGADLGD
jgi:hypothetical protein